jgi:mono/diheme cytochrome c family protein
MKPLLPLAFALALMVLPVGCATLPVPTEESASMAAQQWPGTTLESLRKGRSVYVDTCAACHNLHLPSEFSPERWEGILERMQDKARIDDPTKDLILRYLMTASLQSAAP